ncbi:Gfo/Idh/MocA family oxidoreductase [Herbivorax sp. ANBcel31]|uniref:Gfo/Idh/MocA family protein n=1 Tax=Herbivorax sp. ANBcel31 TaxID=3069754 RepID=UPI0027B10035|nr:Gfo/Idh/MocA family oxidoreductase [Herbivorax sp. ANBcel31]MDQ2085826.1 Gfo/Idh/MocA family oxidoreductase [Herbivorax sp. ANBcel31]
MSKKIRWGILGCGNIAHLFVQGLKTLENAEIHAVASKTPKKAEAFSSKYNIPNYYCDYIELVKNPKVDVVYIATTHNFHFENSMLCLNHGKHVLCEKPFTINSTQAQKLIKTAREKELFIMEAMWTKFFPCIIELNTLLNKGIIGDIRYLRADFGIRKEPDFDGRMQNPSLGGGALLDLGIYPVSFANMIFKTTPLVIKSSCYFGKTGVDEHSSYYFEYDDGQMAHLFSSFISQTPHEALISGTKGYIRILDFFHPSKMSIKLNDCEEKIIEKPYKSTGYNYEANEVMNCIMDGKLESDLMPHKETLKIMKLLDEIRNQWGLKYPED